MRPLVERARLFGPTLLLWSRTKRFGASTTYLKLRAHVIDTTVIIWAKIELDKFFLREQST